MTILRYTASLDTTISNAYAANLYTKGSGSNMGAADVTEVFSIYNQISSSTDGASIEKSRALYQFPITSIISDRTAGTVPASGSVNFYLCLFNVVHSQTLPRDFTLVVAPVSQSWEEGTGLDMEEYTDIGYANWTAPASASASEVAWTTAGGTFLTASQYLGNVYTQYFDKGTEDLEIDISDLVEKWIDTTSAGYTNYGVGVYLTASQEDGSTSGSFYTKKFFARGTQYFFKRPSIEARWDDSKKDDSGNFYLSSSLAPAADNLNTLYLYNVIRGQYQNIPDVSTQNLSLSLYSTLGGDAITLPVGGGVLTNNDVNATASYVTTGIYSASFAYTGASTTIYPVWHSGSSDSAHANTKYHTGSALTVATFSSLGFNPNPTYFTTIKNLKPSYASGEKARLRLFTREKDWSPTIYTKANSTIASEIIESAFYKIERTIDSSQVISYGTGSTKHTQLSYDISGSYFDLDIDLLEPGYSYQIKFVYYVNGQYKEQPETFKFRVE
jgi:hypothetical protein